MEDREEDQAAMTDDINRPEIEPTDQHVQVPMVHVDASRIAVNPFTVHIQLAASMPDGTFWPRVHLTMSPEFAVQLHRALGEALAAGQQADE